MKTFKCRDAGFDCDHQIQAKNVDEVLNQVGEHAQSTHNLEVTTELVEKVKGLIQDEV